MCFLQLAVGTDNKLYVWGASPQVLRHQVHNYKRIKLTQQFDKNYEATPIDWSLTTPFSIDNRHLFPALLPTDSVEGQIVQVSAKCEDFTFITVNIIIKLYITFQLVIFYMEKSK